MEETKAFLKDGLDLDSEDRLVQGYRNALNVNVGTSDGNNAGAVENSLGNRLIPFTLPAGTLKTIGTHSDNVGSSVIYFLFNSTGFDIILRFFIEDESIIEIARGNLFEDDTLITGIGLDDDLLAWTSGESPQKKININKGVVTTLELNLYSEYFPIASTDYVLSILIPGGGEILDPTPVFIVPGPNPATLDEFTAGVTAGINALPESIAGDFTAEDAGTHVILRINLTGYFDVVFSANTANALAVYKNTYQQPILPSYIDLLKVPPVFPPTTSFVFDASVKEINDTAQKIFEFRTRYVYDDGEESVLSPVSKLPVTAEGYPFVEENTSYIEVDYLNSTLSSSAELNIITAVDLFVREENLGAWKKVQTILIDEVIGTNGKYRFLNNEEYAVLDLFDADKNFDSLPIKSNTLAFMNNFLFLDAKLEGYNAVSTNVTLSLKILPEVVFGSPNDRGSFLKRPGSYKWGIIYYDRGNRSSTISKDPTMELTIPGYSDDLSDIIYVEPDTPDQRFGVVETNWQIKHIPPLFATHYSWARTLDSIHNDYVQATVVEVRYLLADKTTTTTFLNGDATYIEVKFIGWDNFNDENPEGTQGWTFTQGDKVRVLKDTGPEAFFTDIKTTPLVEQIDNITFFIENDTSLPLPEIKVNTFLEFYTPGKQVENDIYFETGEFFEVLNPGTANRVHQGQTQSQSVSDPIGTPATGTFIEGDNYRITAAEVGVSAKKADSPRADIRYNALMNSYNAGRINVYTPKEGQAERGHVVRHSRKRFVDSSINGYSSFDSGALYDKLDKSYGNIQHLERVDNILLSLHTREAITLYIEENIYTDIEGVPTVTTSNEVIGNDRVLMGGFGTEHPESFKEHKSRAYWFSTNKGEYVRYGRDGITSLSDILMNTYFKDKGALLKKHGGNVFTTFDQFHDKVIVAFSEIDDGGEGIPAETLSFDDGLLKRWTSFWSYLPEHMSMVDTKVVTFKDGQLWLHDNETRNNFYGAQFTSQIEPVFNESPTVVKVFESISNEGNALWVAIQLVTPEGQVSSLQTDDYKELEEIFYSAILRDENTPNVSNPVTQGDVMRSVAIKALLENDDTSKATLLFATIGFELSKLHAR